MKQTTKAQIRQISKDFAVLLNSRGINASVATNGTNLVVGLPVGAKHKIPKSYKGCKVEVKYYPT